MKKVQGRKIITGILLLLWCVFIFTMSSRPAVQSTEDSDTVVGFFVVMIEAVTDISPEDIDEDFIGALSFIVRKTAHFAEYTVLGVLLALFMLSFPRYGEGKARAVRLALEMIAIGMLYAVSDEIHQYFVPGRAMLPGDVAIDTLGTSLGVGFTLCSHYLYKKKKKI